MLVRRLLCLLGVFVVVACNSVLDIPEAHLKTDEDPANPVGDDDDETCGAGQKSCDGRCVKTNDPETGCANRGCEPCQLANTSTTTCDDDGACAVVKCEEGFGDCDSQNDNGCESDLRSDNEHCFSCEIACGGGLKCIDATCQCRDDEECGEHGGCATDENQDDFGRCYCGNREDPCAVGSACDGFKCVFGD